MCQTLLDPILRSAVPSGGRKLIKSVKKCLHRFAGGARIGLIWGRHQLGKNRLNQSNLPSNNCNDLFQLMQIIGQLQWTSKLNDWKRDNKEKLLRNIVTGEEGLLEFERCTHIGLRLPNWKDFKTTHLSYLIHQWLEYLPPGGSSNKVSPEEKQLRFPNC